MRYLLRRPIGLSVSINISPLTSCGYLVFSSHDDRQYRHGADFTPPLISHPRLLRSVSSVANLGVATPPSSVSVHSSLSLSHLGSELDSGITASQSYDAFDEVLYQADVTGEPLPGGRLVDRPQYRENFQLWTKLLHTRLRLHGLAGAWDIWIGLRLRGVDLPTSGDEADQLWMAFVSAAIQKQTLRDVWRYAYDLYQRTRLKYDLMYDHVVGFFLKNQDTNKALYWHKKFRSIDLPAQGSLARLVDDVVKDSRNLRAFKIIYQDCNDRTIYDKMITALCDEGNFWQAMKWHETCVNKRDYPSSATVTDPLRRRLALSGETDTLRQMTNTLVTAGVSFAGSIPNQLKENTKISRVIMSKLLGEIHGVKPKTISDQFCARSFATRAFSVELVIRGLTAFGVEVIGPLALRELVLRCVKTDEIKHHMKTLSLLGVKIHECAYTETVQRLVYEGNRAMLTSVMDSDMHPDVYDDRRMQKELLKTYILAHDWNQVHRTLMILSASDPAQKTGAWNILLRAYMDAKDWEKINNVFQDMLVLRVFMNYQTIRHSFFSILRPRNRGKRPVSQPVPFDDLSFLTTLWLRNLRSGGDVPATAWRQIHTYYGMDGRYAKVEKLSIWLALYYSRRTVSTISVKEEPATDEGEGSTTLPKQAIRPSVQAARTLDDTDKQNPLREIFTVQRQSAIITWAFKLHNNFKRKRGPIREEEWTASIRSAYEAYRQKAGPVTKVEPYPHWARGVALLKDLREIGVPIHSATVRKACRQRLITLFGHGQSNRRENKVIRSRINVKDIVLLRHMVMFLNCLWGRGLFPRVKLGMDVATTTSGGPRGQAQRNHFLIARVLGVHVGTRKGVRVRRRRRRAQYFKSS